MDVVRFTVLLRGDAKYTSRVIGSGSLDGIIIRMLALEQQDCGIQSYTKPTISHFQEQAYNIGGMAWISVMLCTAVLNLSYPCTHCKYVSWIFKKYS